MKKKILLCLLIASVNGSAQTIPANFEQSGGKESPAYLEPVNMRCPVYRVIK